MSKLRTDAGARVRQIFADQFEEAGRDLIYRRSQKGEAIRVSAEERSRFVADFDRNMLRANWIIGICLTLALGGITALSMVKGSDLPQALMFAAIGLAMVPYVAYYRWVWAAPARALAGRTPIAGERSSEEVRRLGFQRLTYGQLAAAAFGGLMLPFAGSSDGDVFSGWDRLWLVAGGGMVLLAAIQALRKWRFEKDGSYRNALPGSSIRDITGTVDDSGPRGLMQLARYVPLVALAFAIAFILLTPTGKRLAQAPSFWPIVSIGIGCWSLFTVAQGFRKGRIEPFARGFNNTYYRDTQPRRFWASMVWNSILGCFCGLLAFQMNAQARERHLQDRCYNRSRAYSPQEALSACNQLVVLQPKQSDPYLYRGVIFLDGAEQLDQAVKDFTRAHALDPASPWPLVNRGAAYALKNDRARAESDFRKVRKIDPFNPVLLRGEAFLSMKRGDLETAIDRLTTELSHEPADLWSLQMRAETYQKLGQFEKARADRSKLLELSTTNKATVQVDR